MYMCHLQAAAATCRAPLSTKKINRASPPLCSALRGEARRPRIDARFTSGPRFTGRGEKKLDGPRLCRALVRVHARGKRDLPAPRKPTTCKTQNRRGGNLGIKEVLSCRGLRRHKLKEGGKKEMERERESGEGRKIGWRREDLRGNGIAI